jgi:hypothetical protein
MSGPLTVYWSPSDRPLRSNLRTRMMFVGLTPIFHKARLADESVRDGRQADPDTRIASPPARGHILLTDYLTRGVAESDSTALNALVPSSGGHAMTHDDTRKHGTRRT